MPPISPAMPAPLPPWARAVLWAGPIVAHAIDYLYDHVSHQTVVEDLKWRYVVLRWSRTTPIATTEDTAQVGFHISNITGGDLDTSWTTQDYVDCETALTEWLVAINSKFSITHTMLDYRWYQRAFANPMTADARFQNSGPPLRVTPKNVIGANVSLPLPYQAAISITFKTAAPRHWGRVYLPGMVGTEVDNNGRWNSSLCTLMANMTAELVDDLAAKGFQLVVPTTQTDSALQGGLNVVTAIQVDDVPDVIRRRRPSTPKIRTIGVATP